MSRTPPPRRCDWPVRAARIHSPVSRPVSPHCGVRRTRRERGRAENAGGDWRYLACPEYVQGVKDKKYRLMGFGHPRLQEHGPRAASDAPDLYEVLAELKLETHKLFELAMEWSASP